MMADLARLWRKTESDEARLTALKSQLSVVEWKIDTLRTDLAATDSGLSGLERRLSALENAMPSSELIGDIRYDLVEVRKWAFGDKYPGRLDRDLHCSFCNKSQHQVRKLIAGPTVFICDECVDECNSIIAKGTKAPAVAEGQA